MRAAPTSRGARAAAAADSDRLADGSQPRGCPAGGRLRVVVVVTAGAVERLSRAGRVDLVGELDHFGQDRHPVAGDGQEPAVDRGDELVVVPAPDPHRALDEYTEDRLVVGQDADVAVARA